MQRVHGDNTHRRIRSEVVNASCHLDRTRRTPIVARKITRRRSSLNNVIRSVVDEAVVVGVQLCQYCDRRTLVVLEEVSGHGPSSVDALAAISHDVARERQGVPRGIESGGGAVVEDVVPHFSTVCLVRVKADGASAERVVLDGSLAAVAQVHAGLSIVCDLIPANFAVTVARCVDTDAVSKNGAVGHRQRITVALVHADVVVFNRAASDYNRDASIAAEPNAVAPCDAVIGEASLELRPVLGIVFECRAQQCARGA